jgi:hypothetical protein
MTGVHRFHSVLAHARPSEVSVGSSAYRNYNRLLQGLADRTSHSLKQSCGVFSALSPNNGYLGNLQDARRLLEAHHRGKTISQFTVHTYGSNKRKAWEIACGTDPESVIIAHKTRNFYFNLLNPEDPNYVTIDGHMWNIWSGTKRPLKTRDPLRERIPTIKTEEYQQISDDVKTVAQTTSFYPCQVQAILWTVWRRIHGISSDDQITFWPVDAEIAGEGFQL